LVYPTNIKNIFGYALEREGYCRILFDDYKSSSVPILVKKEVYGFVFIDKTTRAIPIKRE
jgi:hypothetical protein